jgi:hypothetical protein
MRKNTTLKLLLVAFMLAVLMPAASQAFAARDDGPSTAAVERMANAARRRTSAKPGEKIGICYGCVCVICRTVGGQEICREYVVCG